jgi:hypothetical protein
LSKALHDKHRKVLTMTDSTNDSSTNPPPPPPPPQASPSVDPAPPAQIVVVKEGAGCWKIGGIVVAVVVVLGLLVGVGCTVLIGGAANEAANSLQESIGLANTTDYEIEITGCAADTFSSARASGTITNTSDKERAFEVQVKFTNPDGSLISTDSTFTDKLDPGQSTNWEVLSLSLNDAAPGFKCDVDEVSNTIFGS